MSKHPIGSMAWLDQTQGVLSFSERMKVIFQGIKAKAADVFTGKQLTQLNHLDLDDVIPPDSAICMAADELAKQSQGAYLYHHCIRSYFWARLLNGKAHFDHEAFYVAVLLHDLGLSDAYQSENQCFTYAAAHAARDLAIEHQWSDQRADLVANAISLHLNVSINDVHGREAQLVRIGSGADVIGQNILRIPVAQRNAVINKYPRLDFKNRIIQDLRQASKHPCCRVAHLRYKLGFDALVKKAPFDE